MKDLSQKNKIIVFGGGTGLSCLLEGLKLFPLDVTTVISVSDNGSSTGVLKEELDIPAVGDIGKVLLAMSNADDEYIDMMQYRFKEGTLNNHPVRNIMLAALIATQGSLAEATKYMSRLLDVKGTVLPLSEEKVDLVGIGINGEKYYGEEEVGRNALHIVKLEYDHQISVYKDIPKQIKKADMLVFSPGSLYTSIIPHLIAKEVVEAIDESNAPIMYVSNLVTQPGETDNFTVSDHINVLNKYLGMRKVDYVIANNEMISPKILEKYVNEENKHQVILDEEKINETGARLIADDIIYIDEGKVRHNYIKTSYLIFSKLMKK